MKFKATVNKLLSNKLVLHVVFAIAFLMILCFLMTNNIDGLVYFVILALVTSYFSKNMIIILGVPVVLVNLFAAKTIMGNIEGFSGNSRRSNDNEDDSNNEDSNDNDSNNDDSNNNNGKKIKMNKKLNNSNDNSNNKQNDGRSSVRESNSKRDNNEEAFEIKRKKTSTGFDVDYASTVEDAYDELNKIIGGDGVKKLTSDTQNLMQQQLQLAEAMKGMQPLIEGIAPLMEQAKGLMGGLGGGGGGGLGGVGGMEGIANLAKQFSNK
jgi:hypothetical protein